MTQEEKNAITTLINRIRAGETAAIEELLHTYRDEAKAAIRSILSNMNRLRRTLDSSDILQSVMLRLHEAAKERVTFPVEDGAAYLGTMARNRVMHHGRNLAAKKRDPNRVSYGEEALSLVADRSATPEARLIHKELLESLMGALSDSEKLVAKERMAYKSWEEIAANSGKKPDTIRKRFHRTLQMLGTPLLTE